MARVFAVALWLFVAIATVPADSSARPKERPPPPVVIAIVEFGGMNILHSDYRLERGDRLRLPASMPPTELIELPAAGSFEERIEEVRSGPLGDMKRGVLYRIKGTRIIGLYVAESSGHDITEDRFHATGTTSAAVGLDHGTNPGALLVYVADGGPEEWEWLEEQLWIDVISTSYYTILESYSDGSPSDTTCLARRSFERIARQGRPVFSAIGNSEQTGTVFSPSGIPENYQVGGVGDGGGRSLPEGPTRPYETGDRFSFPSADADSLGGSMDFGGTSGATPSTAGRAAELVSFARSILGSDVGFSKGALATLGSGGALPARGPLEDGRLTREELLDVMHHTATPAEPPSAFRYLVEGYGAFQEEAMALAKRVLAGQVPEPERAQEDAMHALVEGARPLFFPEARCG